MNIIPTAIAGVMRVDTEPFADHRGAFSRAFCARDLAEILGTRQIVQINLSRTSAIGAIRGLHFQHPPLAEMKMIRCLKGRVFDVAVDLRANSPTFLKYHAEELTPKKAAMLVIPEGCAHGFQVLEPDSELLYLHTAFYSRDAEGGVCHDDPRIGMAWPLPVADLSERDRNHQLLTDDFKGITV